LASENILRATGKSKDSLTGAQNQALNLTGGVIAGMAAAIISQPADTLLSKINKTKGLPGQGTTSRLITMAGQLGVTGLFTGMGARLVMISTLTAGQCEFSLFKVVHTMLILWGSLHLRRYQEGVEREGWCGDRCDSQVIEFLSSCVHELFGRIVCMPYPFTETSSQSDGQSRQESQRLPRDQTRPD